MKSGIYTYIQLFPINIKSKMNNAVGQGRNPISETRLCIVDTTTFSPFNTEYMIFCKRFKGCSISSSILNCHKF